MMMPRSVWRVMGWLSVVSFLSAGILASPRGPSFPCDDVAVDSIEALVCKDADLARLDRRLANVYGQARDKVGDAYSPMLQAEQRGWIKGRNECWKSDDERDCLKDHYLRRIAQLQAIYRLVPGKGPFAFACNDDNDDLIKVTFFPTDPPTLYAERGHSVSLMFQRPSASGARYVGRNESFWEHQGKAMVVWGFQAVEMICSKVP